MLLEKFAKDFRLKHEIDECGDGVIRGRYGDLCEDGPTRVMATFWGNSADARARRSRIAAAVELGYATALPEGCDEAMIVFDPKNKKVARWFIKKMGCARTISVARKEQLLQTLEKARAKRTHMKKTS